MDKRVIDEIKVRRSSGNVYADLGYPVADAGGGGGGAGGAEVPALLEG